MDRGDVIAVAVTSMIYVGPPEAAAGREQMLALEDVGEALTALADRYAVLLPSYELAAEVLRRLGASEDHIAFRLAIAQGKFDRGDGIAV
jgi:hypothetical protein